jgi:hypothetical protein
VADVIGRMKELSEDRLVFLGTRESAPDLVYVAFRSSTGDEMKLVLSCEAMDALVELRRNPMAGMPLRPFPAKMVWQRVNYEEYGRDGAH